MTLAVLVARLGLDEVARRAGVSRATLRRWLREGPSQKGAAVLAAIIKRHLASLRAAESRRRSAQQETGIEPPSESELAPEQVLPTRLPESAREVERLKRREGIEEGSRPIVSEFNIGETTWVTIGEDVNEIADSDLIDEVIAIWRRSGRDNMQVKFLFLRFIPFNPMYKGELQRKQGTWVEQWQSTQAASSPYTMSRYIEFYMERAREWAQTRVIFLEMIGVSTFDRRREVDLKTPLRR